MVKILLDFTKLTQDEVKPRLDYLSKKMKDNPTYSMFQDLVATMDTMGLSYADALFIAKEGGDARLKNKLKAEINTFLTKFARKVEVAANDLASEEEANAFAKGTGFTVQEPTEKKAVGFLEVPADFYAMDDRLRKGACTLSWKTVKGAVTYLIEELDKDGVWQNRGVSKKTSLLFTGTESEVKKTFRIRAIGNGTLVSDYTEAVSVWVH